MEAGRANERVAAAGVRRHVSGRLRACPLSSLLYGRRRLVLGLDEPD